MHLHHTSCIWRNNVWQRCASNSILVIYIFLSFFLYFFYFAKKRNETYNIKHRATWITYYHYSSSNLLTVNQPTPYRVMHVYTFFIAGLLQMCIFNFNSNYTSKSPLNFNVGISTSIYCIFLRHHSISMQVSGVVCIFY